MWRQKLTIWNILLVAGTCLLLIGIYTTWWGAGHRATKSSVAKGPQVPSTPILRDQQPLSAFQVVTNKDLFSPDRRGPTQTQAANQNVLEGHFLLGTIIIGDIRAALIGMKTPPKGKKEAEIDVVYLGEQWNGLKVEEISNESVVFQGKDGQKTLTFPE
jgi:hypothetical protein